MRDVAIEKGSGIASHTASNNGIQGYTMRIGKRLTTFVLLSALWSPALGQQRRPMSEKARQRLEREVRHELVMLPYYGVFDLLAFKLEGEKVVLIGQVTRPTLKSDAERVVSSIEGVEAIDNRIEVLPLSPNDDRIRRATYQAIFSRPGLQRYTLMAVPSIHIIVKNGHVLRNSRDSGLARAG
jgi:hyperosmotically inducible protein